MLKKPLQEYILVWSARGFSAWPFCLMYILHFFDLQSFLSMVNLLCTTICIWECIVLHFVVGQFWQQLIVVKISPSSSVDLVKGFANIDATTFREKDINTDDVIVRLTHRPNQYHYYRWHTLRLNFSKFFFHFN